MRFGEVKNHQIKLLQNNHLAAKLKNCIPNINYS